MMIMVNGYHVHDHHDHFYHDHNSSPGRQNSRPPLVVLAGSREPLDWDGDDDGEDGDDGGDGGDDGEDGDEGDDGGDDGKWWR